MKKHFLLLATALQSISVCNAIAPSAFKKSGYEAENKLVKSAPFSFGEGRGDEASTIAFTQNKGQVHDQYYKPRPDVLYGVTTGNMAVHIKNNGVSYQLYQVDKRKSRSPLPWRGVGGEAVSQGPLSLGEGLGVRLFRIDLTWLNANKNLSTTHDTELPGYNNYYLQSCPNGALNVKSYTGITLHNLYTGIKLHYYQKNGELKHDYIVAPNTDYKQIQLNVEGADISVNEEGSLLLTTPLGKVQEGAPMVYQNGKQLKAKWHVNKNVLSFDIQNYNPNYELIIDPVTRMWGTYYGGGGEEGWGTSTDAAGNVYMSGITALATSTLIATTGSHQSSFGGANDAFLVKFTSTGQRLWGTYYGGSGDDQARSCATDASGNVYMAGYTASSGTVMATAGSHQPAYGGGTYDGFLVQFNSSGVRQWGTYYGGAGVDYCNSCTIDASGNVYLAGSTTSTLGTAIATAISHQSVLVGGVGAFNAFLAKFNSNGARQWGTYYGANYVEGLSCNTDVTGNIYLAGLTGSNTGTVIATISSHQLVAINQVLVVLFQMLSW